MPFLKKDKVECLCKQCGKSKFLQPYKAKTFKFCSNECKWIAKKKQVPVNKLTLKQRIFVKCQNPLCEQGRFIRPSDFKLGRYKYCSRFCRDYVGSKKFNIQIEIKQEEENQVQKRNIWFL